MNTDNKGSSMHAASQDPNDHGKYYINLSNLFILTVFVMSSVGIIGWIFHIPLMTSLIPRFIPIKFNSAVVFLLASIALILHIHFRRYKSAQLMVFAIGSIIFIYGVAVILESIFNIDFKIDQFFMVDKITTGLTPGRPSLFTAVGFILIGLSLNTTNIKLFNSIRPFIDATIFFCGLLILNSLSFDINQKAQIITYATASIYTAISFLLLSLVLMMRKLDIGIMAVLTDHSDGGFVARALFPAILLIPIIFSFTRMYAEFEGWLDSITGHVLYTFFTIFILLSITFFISKQLIRHDLDRDQSEHQFNEVLKHLQCAIVMSPIGMAVLSSQGHFTEVNHAFCKLTGFSNDELLTMKLEDVFTSYSVIQKTENQSKQETSDSTYIQYDDEYARPDGKVIWLQVIISSLKMNDVYSDDSFLVEIEDITLRKDYEERIHELAYHDQLTQLPNRRLLIDRLGHAITGAHRHHKILAILFLDLDNFKFVNDTYGHDIGDELIKAVAVRLTALFRQEDTVARISGDEFVLLLNSVNNVQDAGIVAEKAIVQIRTLFLLSGHEISISGSIGIALYPYNGTTTTQLLKNADHAMYQAKKAGKNQYRFAK